MSAIALLASCVWVPRDDGGYHHEHYREGYYDRDHGRYWHDNGWHQCRDRDDAHCH